MTPEQKLGQRVAWALFGLVAVVHAVVLVLYRLSPGGRDLFPLTWAVVMLFTAIGYGVLTPIVAAFVPQPSRAAYWPTVWIGFGILMGLSGVSCFVVGFR